MSTRLTVITVSSMSGVGKESHQPYSMMSVTFLVDFEPFQKRDDFGVLTTDRQGSGFSICELPVSPSFYPRLHAFFSNEQALKRQPLVIEFETSVRPRGRQTETVITDFSDAFKVKYPALKDQAAA